MATPKRKRKSTRAITSKRPKYADASDEDPHVSEQEWAAESILKERRRAGKTEYLVEWKDIDPGTGSRYLPTWEPAAYINTQLLASWQEEQQKQQHTAKPCADRRSSSRQLQESQTRTPQRGQKRPIVESSPEPSTAHASTASSRISTPAPEAIAQLIGSSAITTPISAQAERRPASPRVPIPRRGTSLDREAYDYHSWLAASQAATAQSQSQETDLDSSALFTAHPRHCSSGVVPDTQSSAGEGTFIPVTQETTGTTQETIEEDEIEEDVTGDSGLLEIIRAASPVPSTARSIPETICDTSGESQSQRPGTHVEKPIEIPDTLDTLESSLGTTRKEAQARTQESDTNSEPQRVPQEHPRLPGEYITLEQSSLPSSGSQAAQPRQTENLQDSISLDNQLHLDYGSSQEPALVLEQREEASPSIDVTASPAPDSTNLKLNVNPYATQEPVELNDNVAQNTGQALSSGWDDPSLTSDIATSCQDIRNAASLAEHPNQDEAAQVTDHSHHQLAVTTITSETPTNDLVAEIGRYSIVLENTDVGDSNVEQHIEEQTITGGLEESVPSPTSPLRSTFEAQINSVKPTASKLAQIQIFVPSTYNSKVASQSYNSSGHASSPVATSDYTPYREQHAQIIGRETNLSTQEDFHEVIVPSVEKDEVTRQGSPESRHDSSQESPERQLELSTHSSSSIAPPPKSLLDAFDSVVPARPKSPPHTSSLSDMAGDDSGDAIARKLREELAKRQAENPFTPTRGRFKFSSPAAIGAASTTSERRLLRTGASPATTAKAADGTRSPSSIPDHSPAPPAPTSLRTIALSHSSQIRADEAQQNMHESMKKDLSTTDPIAFTTEEQNASVPAIITTEATVPGTQSSDDEELSDADVDDAESLLNDDLQLDVDEYIVPLFIDGRQSDTYSAYIKQKWALLDSFLNDPSSVSSLTSLEETLSHLRAIETHYDLVFAEAQAASTNESDAGAATQMQFAAQFGVENSIKFRFLHSLFHELRTHDKHVILVIDEDNDALLKILETFCKAEFIHYSLPTKGRQADNADGLLSVTIFPSGMSPVIRPADVIVCLDGVHDAAQIRQKSWGKNPEIQTVPILHLVIPRTIGHIERYLSDSLDKKTRIHTIFASLAQLVGDLGTPVNDETPRATIAADLVAEWLKSTPEDRGEWPLVSIGSVKDIIQFESQMSQASSASPVPERAKRPHDDEEPDFAKRMRFTPQPQTVPSSSVNHEVTRISDSMPGTASDIPSQLREQMKRSETAYQIERASRRAEASRFKELEETWERQQTVHEDLSKEYRLLLGKHQSIEERLETVTKNNDTLRERLTARTTELRTLSEQLEQQRSTGMLSEDEKIAEITKLRKELAQANDDKARALRSATTAEKTLDYTNDQYRKAQDAASSSQAIVAELEVQNAKLQFQASGQPAKLKALHLDNQYENVMVQNKALRAEVGILKKAFAQKDEELQRAKLSGGRMGVGTRATSATPQPKVRSRAASPMGGRLSNLRNG